MILARFKSPSRTTVVCHKVAIPSASVAWDGEILYLCVIYIYIDMVVSQNKGTPQIIHFNRNFQIFHYDHPFWGTFILGNLHEYVCGISLATFDPP